MTIKQTLGETTEQLETQAQKLWTDYSPYYTNLEPYQRGLILIALTVFLTFTIYYLTKEDKDKATQRKARAESLMEERIVKRMELLKKLRE